MNYTIAQIKDLPEGALSTLLMRKDLSHPKEDLKGLRGGLRTMDIIMPLIMYQRIAQKPQLKGVDKLAPKEYLLEPHVLSRDDCSRLLRTLGFPTLGDLGEFKKEMKQTLVDAVFGDDKAFEELGRREESAAAVTIVDCFDVSRKDLFSMDYAEMVQTLQNPHDDLPDDYPGLQEDIATIINSEHTDQKKKKLLKHLLLCRFARDVSSRQEKTVQEIMEECLSKVGSSGSDDEGSKPKRGSPKRKFTELTEEDCEFYTDKKTKLSLQLLESERAQVDRLMDGLCSKTSVQRTNVSMVCLETSLLNTLVKDPTAKVSLTSSIYEWLGKQLFEACHKVSQPEAEEVLALHVPCEQ